MSIASQYVRGAKKAAGVLPPVLCGVMSITKGFLPEVINESPTISTAPTATESISESVEVTLS